MTEELFENQFKIHIARSLIHISTLSDNGMKKRATEKKADLNRYLTTVGVTHLDLSRTSIGDQEVQTLIDIAPAGITSYDFSDTNVNTDSATVRSLVNVPQVKCVRIFAKEDKITLAQPTGA